MAAVSTQSAEMVGVGEARSGYTGCAGAGDQRVTANLERDRRVAVVAVDGEGGTCEIRARWACAAVDLAAPQ